MTHDTHQGGAPVRIVRAGVRDLEIARAAVSEVHGRKLESDDAIVSFLADGSRYLYVAVAGEEVVGSLNGYSLTGVGLCLKPANSQGPFPETADVRVSVDGENWSQPVAHYENATTNKGSYATFETPQKARFVKVHITDGKGWRSLNEIELYAE